MREYTQEELSLILRHEIIHISRGDPASKFFLTFCTAMCWFNPLMWAAMRKSADDFELSCDESVLLDEPQPVRRQYAELLLQTAGDERGFTTCLSATAGALRYRLKNIMKPEKKRTGAILVGLTLFVLAMCSGYVALAYDAQPGTQRIFDGQDLSAVTVSERRPVERSARQGWHLHGRRRAEGLSRVAGAGIVYREARRIRLRRTAGADRHASTRRRGG